MVFRIQSAAFAGIEATPIEVQVQVSAGMPAFTIVGLPIRLWLSRASA
jgi:magnesium chelatase family protein